MLNYVKEHGFDEQKINDCHYHNGRQHTNRETSEIFRKHREYLNLEKILVLALTEGLTILDPTSNIKALYLKEDDRENIYAFAALHHFHDERDNAESYLKQIQLFCEMGFDGIKMLEGKGECRSVFTQKLDSDAYSAFFAYAEEHEIPILIHAGDIPQSREDEILYSEILKEIENVLERYPKLYITFAHMFFMTKKREKLEYLMDTYKNISVDLSMGGPILPDFSKDIDVWRKFFEKYSERILFATDGWNTYFEGEDDFEVTCRHEPLRDFFERKEEFTTRVFGEKTVIKPALLPQEIVDNIYRNNFVRLFGEKPKKVNYPLALKYAEWMLEEYKQGRLKTYSKSEELPPWYTKTEKKNMLRGTELAIENLEEIMAFYQNIKK